MSRTLSIWRWQLIFTGTMVAMVGVLAAFMPHLLGSPRIALGLTVLVLTTLVTLMLPWPRIPQRLVALVPLVDAFSVGFLADPSELHLEMLWVLPVAWLASYFGLAWVFSCIGFIAVLLVLFGHETEPNDLLMRVLIVVLTLSFLGTTIRLGAQRSRAARRLLKRQSEQVSRAAERAELQQLRVTQIIDALDVALVVVDASGRIHKMNDAYRALYGRDRYGAVLPLAAVEYEQRRGAPVPPERTVLARAARGEAIIDERVWLFDSRGQWRALQVGTQTMAGTADDLALTLVIIDDVTALLDAEQERRAMSAMVSHELRNPLTAIMGHVDLLLEREDLPARAVEQLQVIANAGERMHRLVDGTLQARGEEQALLAESVDLRDVAEASAASFAPIADANGLTLQVEGGAGIAVHGDAFRLRQVLDNLIGNAVKYTPKGGRITVRLAEEGGRVVLTIADTGIGMDAEELDRLFEPYFRTERAVRSGIPGTGLGMGITRDIVAAHGGSIDVTSDVGGGTSVRLTLPRHAGRGSGGDGGE